MGGVREERQLAAGGPLPPCITDTAAVAVENTIQAALGGGWRGEYCVYESSQEDDEQW